MSPLCVKKCSVRVDPENKLWIGVGESAQCLTSASKRRRKKVEDGSSLLPGVRCALSSIGPRR